MPPTVTKPGPEPCLWVRDLDDTTSDAGRQAVAAIRQLCQCKECEQLRKEGV